MHAAVSVASMGRQVETRLEHRVTVLAVANVNCVAFAGPEAELHAAAMHGRLTMCGLPVGEVLYQPWPPEAGGCYRCHVL